MLSGRNDNPIAKYIAIAVNEPTVGLCQIQQHIKLTVPKDIQKVSELKHEYESLVAAIPDIERTILYAKQAKVLGNTFLPNMRKHLDLIHSQLDRARK